MSHLDLEQRFARAMKRGEKQDAKSHALKKKRSYEEVSTRHIEERDRLHKEAYGKDYPHKK